MGDRGIAYSSEYSVRAGASASFTFPSCTMRHMPSGGLLTYQRWLALPQMQPSASVVKPRFAPVPCALSGKDLLAITVLGVFMRGGRDASFPTSHMNAVVPDPKLDQLGLAWLS